MHLYHCGRNLDIYVTVVNRFSNLSWMISQLYCWSWDMHRLVPIYLLTHLFYCFCLKSPPNVNLQMKRDIELQKPIAYTSIWLGKRESDIKWNVWCRKSQRLTHQIEISKISGINLTMRCIDSKRSNNMMYMEPNEKIHMLCNQVLWEVIYAYFYNWDGSLYLVLIVYGLVELIIEASH